MPADKEKMELYKIIEKKEKLPVGYRMIQSDSVSLNQATTFTWRLGVKSPPEIPRFIIVGFQTNKSGIQRQNPLLCTYPVLPNSVHVCIYFEWFPLWLFLELDFLLWNIVLEVSGPVYNLITRNYSTEFNMNFLEVSLLL